MSESLDPRYYLVFVVGLIVFVICFIKVFLKGKTRKQKFIEKAKAGGYYTTGKCVDTKIYRGSYESNNASVRNSRLKVTYQYFVNGIAYKKKMTFQSPGCASIDYPYRVTVYYKPGNPAKSVCPEEATDGQQKERGCVLTIIYTFIAMKIAVELLERFLL